MSMYSELLTGLCQDDADPLPLPSSREDLVVILLQCRRRLVGHGLDGHEMAENLALELDHDRMLLRLCGAMGIESDPGRFANPLAERQRLEGLLHLAGVDFRTLDDHRRVKVA